MHNRAMRWTSTLAISVILAITLCAHYVHNEHPAYIWDFTGYWGGFQAYGYMFSTSPLQTVATVFQQIRTADYNPAPVLGLLPFYFLFGEDRTPYIIAIAVAYLIPAAFVITLMVARVAKIEASVALFAICATIPALWMPSLRGQPDIVGIIFLAGATLLLFKSNFLNQSPLKFGAAIGLCLYAPFLLRRWYAYSIVLFVASAFAIGICQRIADRQPAKSFLSLCVGLGVAIAVFVGFLIVFQSDFALRAITTSYSELYGAYQTTFTKHVMLVSDRASILTIGLMLVGSVIAVRQLNFEALFCLCAGVGTFLLFIRTQYMGLHHSLPIFMWLAPLMIVALEGLARKTRLTFPFVAACSVLILVVATSPFSRNFGCGARLIFPAFDMTPLHLDNYQEYQRLTADLEGKVTDGSKTAVFASSANLSDSLLTALNPKLKASLVAMPHIAAVQGFPREILDAQYVVVATPDQSHLAPGTQENVLLPGRWILNGTGLGQAYGRISQYNLQKGVTAFLYQRTRPIAEEEKRQLLNELARLYPNSPALFPKYIGN